MTLQERVECAEVGKSKIGIGQMSGANVVGL